MARCACCGAAGRYKLRSMMTRLVQTKDFYRSERSGEICEERGKRVMELSRGKAVRLEEGCGWSRVVVRSGVVWITGTPGTEDVVLRAGEGMVFGENWPFVVEALEGTEVEMG